MKDPFYTKSGLLTRYSFACGYVERRRGLSLYMEHGTYQVRGFRKKEGEEKESHITGSFSHVKEARRFVSKPFTHKVSRDGSVSIAS